MTRERLDEIRYPSLKIAFNYASKINFLIFKFYSSVKVSADMYSNIDKKAIISRAKKGTSASLYIMSINVIFIQIYYSTLVRK
jgi:hypothetical protein